MVVAFSPRLIYDQLARSGGSQAAQQLLESCDVLSLEGEEKP